MEFQKIPAMLKPLKHFDLKSFRRALRLTQVELGKVLGVSNNLISSMELGKAQLSLATFDKLREAFPDVDFTAFELESAEGLVKEPDSRFTDQNAKVLFDMYQSKDQQLTQCNEEKAALLREIIRLKDELAALRKET